MKKPRRKKKFKINTENQIEMNQIKAKNRKCNQIYINLKRKATPKTREISRTKAKLTSCLFNIPIGKKDLL